MRTVLDFSPLHRSSIGYDRVFDLLEAAARTQTNDNWPPFDSVKLSEDKYRITMAVAGFSRGDINITVQGNMLTVTGERKGEQEGEVLHRGIANRPFNRRFELADHMQVTGAHMENGLLVIDLKREIPEAYKLRRVEIGEAVATTATPAAESIQSQAA
ncbi:molecular chaperone IbpA [Dyella jiangningensis]|uniref:Hsp20 family protein n=1 Tax=Dyella sp. AtDHG13 TaxID=1938897 RepID=UPI00087E3756|nr:Hsp20 family protein [Dyella sp. AtDHG13]PXV58991.1 molecular chaperone IbpA [Dyella sp. AtDHG13]SDL30551.1 molecular chaperone IbpA [Dyella jiangningensis]